MQTIKEMMGFESPQVWTTGRAIPLPCADPSLLYGLELELENIPEPSEWLVQGVRYTEDHSLRNSGYEFITSPMTFSVVAHVLGRFYNKNKINDRNISERCSVHVHANCLDLTFENVAGIALLYQVFEKLLFAFAGGGRDQNIFCVPWSETTLTANILTTPDYNFRSWQKYTALNVLPLYAQGTIEFRHLPAQTSYVFILDWLNLIGSMFAYARKHPYQEIQEVVLNLNRTSIYYQLVEQVFTNWARLLSGLPNFNQLLEEGVLAAKYSLVSRASKEKPNKAKKITYRFMEPVAAVGGWLDERQEILNQARVAAQEVEF